MPPDVGGVIEHRLDEPGVIEAVVLEEALVLSDVVYLLGQGPRARIRQRYTVPIPRPRDIMKARTNPSFAPLLERLWRDLSNEVDVVRRVA